MHASLKDALARLSPITVGQTAVLARALASAADAYAAALRGQPEGDQAAILAIAGQLDEIADAVAVVVNVAPDVTRGLTLAEFAEFLPDLLKRLVEVNGPELRERFVPALPKIADAVSAAQSQVPTRKPARKAAPRAAA